MFYVDLYAANVFFPEGLNFLNAGVWGGGGVETILPQASKIVRL
jgi:hypothetical protein